MVVDILLHFIRFFIRCTKLRLKILGISYLLTPSSAPVQCAAVPYRSVQFSSLSHPSSLPSVPPPVARGSRIRIVLMSDCYPALHRGVSCSLRRTLQCKYIPKYPPHCSASSSYQNVHFYLRMKHCDKCDALREV